MGELFWPGRLRSTERRSAIRTLPYGVAPTPLHMLQYCQLHYQFLFGRPHHAPRGTTLELERA